MNAPEIRTEADYRDAVAQARAAADAYYNDNGPLVMDDTSYDLLVRAIDQAADTHPEWGRPADLLDQIAAGTATTNGADTITHSRPMLSLDNAMDTDEFDAWWARTASRLDTDTFDVAIEPKLDGLAWSATYRDGTLTQLATRGDGTTGENITAAAARAHGLPRTVNPDTFGAADFEVRGEAVLTRHQFSEANTARIAAGKDAFVNPRNAMGGIMRASDATAEWTAVAYQLVDGPTSLDRHTTALAHLEAHGFHTGNQYAPGGTASTLDSAHQIIARIEAARDTLDVDIDGAVTKVDRVDQQNTLGYRSRAPRWAIARKYTAETRTTVLRDIETSIGRTGALTLRAVLEPVHVAGTTISYATLNNPEHIARIDVRIGDTVWVRRAGDVIPEIVGVHLTERPDTSSPWEPPAACPRCGSEWDRSSVIWRCTRRRACGAAEALIYAVSRDALDIEGLGTVHARALADTGIVDVADLFAITRAQLLALPRMGDSLADKILTQIERARIHPMHRILIALGIRLTGRTISRELARHFGTMAALRSATVEQLAECPRIGQGRAESIHAELAELAPVLDRLAQADIGQIEPAGAGAELRDGSTLTARALEGRNVVITGSFDGHDRRSIGELAESHGATVRSSVSKNVDLLICGTGTENGSKARKARELGVDVMDAATFLAL